MRLLLTLSALSLLTCVTLSSATAAERASLWVDLYRGEPIPFASVTADLATAEVVYLGERHRVKRHHDLQAEIIEKLGAECQKTGRKFYVAFEQVEKNWQKELDDYTAGKMTFDAFAKKTEREKHWGSFPQYRDVFEKSRTAKATLLALNAPSGVIRSVAMSGGVAKLNAKTRALLPKEMTLTDPTYEKWLLSIMAVHRMATPERMRPMIEAQISRDETMAEVIASVFKGKLKQKPLVVVVCGAGHVNYGLGTPDRVRRYLPKAKERIILFSESGDVVLTEQEKAVSREVSVTHESLRELRRPIADYLHVTERK